MRICDLNLMVYVVLNANSHFNGFKVRGYKVVKLLFKFLDTYVCVCFLSVKQRSREGLEAARMELEEREKVCEELQGIRVWLEVADGRLSEMEQSSSTQELQVGHSSKLLFIRVTPHRLFVSSLQQTSSAFILKTFQSIIGSI